MNLTGLFGDLIDLRSFSTIWYWLALACLWSSQAHWICGVPFDMVRKMQSYAARQDYERAEENFRDIITLLRVNSRRRAKKWQKSATLTVFLHCLFGTILACLAFYYWFELAQALFCLLIPLVAVAALKLRLALYAEHPLTTDEDLMKRLIHVRVQIQFLGMIVITLTTLFGMWRNISQSVFY